MCEQSAVLKGIISLYGAVEEKSIERYKTRIKIGEEHRTISAFKRNLIDFLGLSNQAKKFVLGSFDLKLYRLVKISGKTENFSLSTQQQLDLELPLLLDLDGESELNGGSGHYLGSSSLSSSSSSSSSLV